MTEHVSEILLWLFVIFSGVAVGAGLQEWWLIAAAISLVERIGTLSYFIPRGLKLMRAEALPSAKATAMASQWMALNYVRAALALIGWLAALRALSLPA